MQTRATRGGYIQYVKYYVTTKPAVRPESEWPKNSYSCRSICLVAHTVPRQSRLLPGAKDQTVSHRQYHAVYAGAAVTRFRMAGCAGECDAEDLHRLASCRFSPVLALEVTTGASTDTGGTARTHTCTGARQSILGARNVLPMRCYSSSGSGFRPVPYASTWPNGRADNPVSINAGQLLFAIMLQPYWPVTSVLS